MNQDQLKEWADRQSAIMQEIQAEDPSLPVITAIVMAGDRLSAERAEQYLADGMPFERAVHMVGSYARLDFAVKHAPHEWVLDNLPDLWRGSDPDDADERYLDLWREAWWRNGQTTILDGEPPPDGDPLTVYRGQPKGATQLGIAWTTDLGIAQRFANGASYRTAIEGEVIEHQVKRENVLAYLTERGESEVILDPTDR